MQMDYGQNCEENPLKKGRIRNAGYSNVESVMIDPWKTSTDSIGGHCQGCVTIARLRLPCSSRSSCNY